MLLSVVVTVSTKVANRFCARATYSHLSATGKWEKHFFPGIIQGMYDPNIRNKGPAPQRGSISSGLGACKFKANGIEQGFLQRTEYEANLMTSSVLQPMIYVVDSRPECGVKISIRVIA